MNLLGLSQIVLLCLLRATVSWGFSDRPCPTITEIGNFSCPLDATKAVDANGNWDVNPTYLNEDDCRLFYVCLNGVKPQLGGCPVGTVFNDVSRKCDEPINVPGW